MPENNDNRMGWLRNLEALASGCQQYTVEYELSSECQIPGLLDYAGGKIICAAISTEESRDGFATVAHSDSTHNLINLFSASINKSYRYRCIFLFVDLASVGNADA
jgi:hypothetical protein